VEGPERIEPKGLNDYLAVLTKAAFQSGISWRVIEAKWPGFEAAFLGFDPERIARLTPQEVDALVADTRIVRNRRKIEGTVKNARTMLDLNAEYGSFQKYLRSHDGFEATVADLSKRFAFIGRTGAYYFLHVVGEKVPPHEEVMAAAPPSRARTRTRGSSDRGLLG
jgi:3-methyladenine DNA glycosylase Tag